LISSGIQPVNRYLDFGMSHCCLAFRGKPPFAYR
jgi:hypothetical protein